MTEKTSNISPADLYPATASGLRQVIQDKITVHGIYVAHQAAAVDDQIGRTGGGELMLYPNPNRPSDTIRISAAGRDAAQRLLTAASDVNIAYLSRQAPAAGQYHVTSDYAARSTPLPGSKQAREMHEMDTDQYSGLIQAISQASPVRPSKAGHRHRFNPFRSHSGE